MINQAVSYTIQYNKNKSVLSQKGQTMQKGVSQIFARRGRTSARYPLQHVGDERWKVVEANTYNRGAVPNVLHSSYLLTTHSLSVVLPAYNEEQVIEGTLMDVLDVLNAWVKDFEVIVVNDGSADRTEELVSSIVQRDGRVRLVTHETNQGYGAAIADGFAAATKELTFFMDSDGQFDIRDLMKLLPFVDEYDAVIGYRMSRQDTLLRRANAWGWKILIALVLGVYVRDLDCAFKLIRTEFLHQHPLETRGAMINAELMYKLRRANYSYREVGVQHLPRRAGRSTGANLRVILRAFRELFTYERKWRREEDVLEQDYATHEVSV